MENELQLSKRSQARKRVLMDKATIIRQSFEIKQLEAQLIKRDERIEQLEAVIKNLTKRIAELKAKPIKRRRKNYN